MPEILRASRACPLALTTCLEPTSKHHHWSCKHLYVPLSDACRFCSSGSRYSHIVIPAVCKPKERTYPGLLGNDMPRRLFRSPRLEVSKRPEVSVLRTRTREHRRARATYRLGEWCMPRFRIHSLPSLCASY